MHPILFNLFGLEVPSFGVIVALAFLVGFLWIFKRARQSGQDENLYLEAACWIIISAVLGARLFYVLFFPEAFFRDPIGALTSRGGLVWYGGMLGVTLAVIAYTRIKNINLWQFGDIITPPAALGLAIGRIGCLLAGCCYGGPTNVPWAIHYPHDHETHGVGVHPAPLYESLSLLIVTLLLVRIERTQTFHGKTTWMFFLLYGFVRFMLEYLRGDRLVWIAALNLSASQVISLLGVLLGGVMLWVLKSKSRPVEASVAVRRP